MTKTGQEIEDDLYEFVKTSSLAGFINGGIYKFGLRPKNSKKEDMIVKFVEASDTQIQSGTIVLNIYVLDFDAFDNGDLVRDVKRCKEIEIETNRWVKSLTTNKSEYKFALSQAIYTVEEPDIKQHFVSIRLKFKLTTF